MAAARPQIRLRFFLVFAALGLAGVAAMAAGLALGWNRLRTPELSGAFLQGGLFGAFGILGLTLWGWYLFDSHVVRPAGAVAAALRARAHGGVDQALEVPAAWPLGDLAPAAAAAAQALAEARAAVQGAGARETAHLASEKHRLERLLADVELGVILCSGRDQLVFYNGAAAAMIGAGPGQGLAPGLAPGLDRALFDYLRAGPIRDARDRLRATGDDHAASDILCATVGGARVLAARMRILPDEAGMEAPGYVLTLRDVTADLAAEARRDALLAEMTDRLRRPAANLQALLEVLPEGEAAPRDLDGALRAEVRVLTDAVRELARQQEEARAEDMRHTPARATDLLDGLRARIEAQGRTVTTGQSPLLMRCNGPEVIALLAHLAVRIADQGLATAFRLAIEEEGALALLRLGWTGAPLPVARLEGWLAEPPDPAIPTMTGQDILHGHGTEIWPETGAQGEQRICLPLRSARHAGQRPPPLTHAVSRAVVYDFDLLDKTRHSALAETPLSELTYVVFDTETTGLLPAEGDEIVQIAALRIVNGRRVAGEVFETLVDPGRAIPALSTRVHGITQQMVAGAPDIAGAGRALHDFARGSVLIAHNAPFDMAFLRRHEAAIGARFDHPVLDTVLLSAVVFGRQEDHSLDALCARLGITIPEEDRHTALGDAGATAGAFLRMLPMLQARGILTFGAVLAEMRRHGRLLKDLN